MGKRAEPRGEQESRGYAACCMTLGTALAVFGSSLVTNSDRNRPHGHRAGPSRDLLRAHPRQACSPPQRRPEVFALLPYGQSGRRHLRQRDADVGVPV